jgi:hypothetical protein
VLILFAVVLYFLLAKPSNKEGLGDDDGGPYYYYLHDGYVFDDKVKNIYKTKDNKFKATFDGKKYILKPGSILNKDKPDEDYEGLSAQQACGKQQICGSYVINTNADKNGDYSVTFKEIPPDDIGYVSKPGYKTYVLA